MTSRSIVGPFIAGIIGVSLSMNAASQGIPARGPVPFATYDRNSDGVVSEAELDAVREQLRAQGRPMRNAPTFAELDRNHDGKLTPAELAARPGAQMGRAPGARAAAQGKMPSFADFDLNGDGKITEQEFNEARAARIAEQAQAGRGMRGLATARSYADIDTNRDGAVTPEEFAAHQAAQRQQMSR